MTVALTVSFKLKTVFFKFLTSFPLVPSNDIVIKLHMQFNEFEYHFACSRKDVHFCFIMSPVALTVSFNVKTDKYLTYIYFHTDDLSIVCP